MNPPNPPPSSSPSTPPSQLHSHILHAKNTIVQNLIFNYGSQMYNYQEKLLQKYMRCREREEPSCHRYQEHPVIRLEKADNNFMGCLDAAGKYAGGVEAAIDGCVREYEGEAGKVFEREFLKCEQLLREY